jgi:Heterokaryon incompatibility protein (HET)
VADLIFFDGIAVHGGADVRHVQYDALSYIWGSPELKSRIQCNMTELQITESLRSALQHLRHHDNSRYLWVDAICIHQDDNKEKAAQVRNMMVIYRKAKVVVAWLGNGQQLLNDFFLLCHRASSSEKLTADMQARLQVGLQNFVQLPYFYRVWVQQEAYVASRLVFCAKSSSIDSTTVQLALVHANPSRSAGLSKLPGLFGLSPVQFLPESPQAPIIGSDTSNTRKAVDLLEALCITGGLEASNPLDKIYAVLGVTATPTTVVRKRDKQSRSVGGPYELSAERPLFLID